MNRKVAKFFEILIFLFGIFLIYQILRIVFGGSWTIEELILALLIFVVGAVFTIVIMLVELKSDHKHLKNQFKCLARDFRSSKIYK